jgi:hypothetical protein
MPDAADKARALLEKNTGSAVERAQVYATLAACDAMNRMLVAMAVRSALCGDCGSDCIQFAEKSAE